MTIVATLSGHLPALEDLPVEDFELQRVRAARAGDMEAFDWLVRRHEHRAYSMCYRWLRCEEDARDVCQDAFVKAWQALPEFEERASFSTWICQIALNLCRDRAKTRFAKQQRLTVVLDDLPQTVHCPQQSPASQVELKSDLEKLHLGLAAMPEKLSQPLILTAIDGFSHEECAAILGCSVRAVEGRVHRARKALLGWWREEEAAVFTEVL
ncbi:MAG: RNA polymerase sigma factor [Verrucomicrobiaceae bacterium]